MDQLKWFTELLNEYGIYYWLDSGTLLGLIREGRLLPTDPDLDIGMWEMNDNSAMQQILEIMIKEGFRVRTHTYKGTVYAYTIVLQDASNHYSIDIGVFGEHGQHAFRPSPMPKRNFLYKNTTRILNLLSKVQAIFSRKNREKTKFSLRMNWYDAAHTLTSTRTAELTAFPWKMFYNIGTWWIPSSYFKNTTVKTINDLDVRVPENYEGYLEYRYGNWRIPAKGWSYTKHDKAFKHKLPDELIEIRDVMK